jgi:hypothetical protein
VRTRSARATPSQHQQQQQQQRTSNEVGPCTPQHSVAACHTLPSSPPVAKHRPQHSHITATFALRLLPQNTPRDTHCAQVYRLAICDTGHTLAYKRRPCNNNALRGGPASTGAQHASSDASNSDTQPCARNVTMCVRPCWSVVSPADHHASRLRMCGLPPGARVCCAHWWAARTTSSAAKCTVEACVLAKRRVDGQPRC